MKTRFLLAALCLTFGMTTMTAQNKDGKPERTPEQRIDQQAMRMVDALSLDDKTAEKFVTTYKNFKNDMMEVMKKYPHAKHATNEEGEKARKTDTEIEKDIQDNFAKSREILDVRERYYKEFRKFLNPRQIKKMYGMEREGMKKLGGPRKPMKAGRPGGPRGNQWQGHHRGNHQRPQCQNPEKGTTQNETQKK